MFKLQYIETKAAESCIPCGVTKSTDRLLLARTPDTTNVEQLCSLSSCEENEMMWKQLEHHPSYAWICTTVWSSLWKDLHPEGDNAQKCSSGFSNGTLPPDVAPAPATTTVHNRDLDPKERSHDEVLRPPLTAVQSGDARAVRDALGVR